MINGIVCVDKNFAIGKNNAKGKPQLLFNISADMAYFKEKTLHNIVVMGYTTYLSLPKKPLSDRVNLVLWDKATSPDCLEGCITFNNFDVLLKFVKVLSKIYEVFVIGGASVYNLFMPYYDRLFITKVAAEDKEATAFFPNIDKDTNFELVSKMNYAPKNEYPLSFTIYSRIKENK